MHYVCSPFGSSGDVHPMLGLAVALQSRGHQVTVICNGYFEELITSRGLAFQQLGTREQFLSLVARSEVWKPFEAFQYLYHEGVAKVMREHYDLLAEHHRNGPMVAISSMFGFGALVAQEKLGIPLVSLHLQPSVIWSDIDPPRVAGLAGPRWWKRLAYRLGERLVIDRAVCPSLNQWRAELGLSEVHAVTRWWHSPWAVACFFPEWFAAAQADWPRPLLQSSFPLWDERTKSALPADIQSYLTAGDPPIVFTPGSANVFGQPFFAAAVDACRRLGRRGLLLTRFPEQLPQPLPDFVRHVAYLPFSQLLPHCAALVHHGGVGSMSQAMAAGIPQLILSLAHDQFDNGQRVQRLGVGAMIKHHSASGARVARRLEPLLTSSQVARNCRIVKTRLADVDGCDQMATAIEQYVEAQRTVNSRTGT